VVPDGCVDLIWGPQGPFVAGPDTGPHPASLPAGESFRGIRFLLGAVGGVFGNWPRIVGPELARHTKPERFDDGELTIVADSNAWAQQVRLLSAQLVRRLNEELGHGTVRRVKVLGPASGPRRPGAWRVR